MGDDVLERASGDASAGELNGSLRSYAGPWKGELVLACSKCQRKLRGEKSRKAVVKLKKSLKAASRRYADGPRVKLIQVSCLKMCPKGAVTVCTREQMARSECSLLRTAEDVEALYRMVAGAAEFVTE